MEAGRRVAAASLVALVVAGVLAPSAPLHGQAPVADTVSIRLEDGAAIVVQTLPSPGWIEAFAIDLPGQSLEVLDVSGPTGAVESTLIELDGGRKIAIPTSSPARLRYRVTGELDRIPLFVEGGRAELTVSRGEEAAHVVRLSGEAGSLAGIDTDVSMPRFTRLEDGTLEVTLSSVPSFIRLSDGGAFSFARIADALALALIGLGAFVAYRKLAA